MAFEYMNTLNRDFYGGQTFWPDETPKLEDPIIPISELGTTIVEKHPQTGANMIQNAQAAIRAGAGVVQLVLTTPSTAAIGGRPKAYGKEVREAMKEMAKANELTISGIEMPTSSMSNLSGFDPQRGMSEEKRNQDMEEVRDAIKFAADIAGGGGVDIWSQEFPRTIFDADFNEKGKWKNMFESHPEEKENAVKHLVDERDGRIIQSIRVNQIVEVPVWNKHKGKSYEDYNKKLVTEGAYIDHEGNLVDREDRVPKWNAEEQKFETTEKKFADFEEEARALSTAKKTVTVHEAFYRATLDSQIGIAHGWALQYARGTQDAIKAIKEINEWKKDPVNNPKPTGRGGTELSNEDIEDQLFTLRREVEANKEQSTSQWMQKAELERQREAVTTLDKYAFSKTIKSYSELGIFSMDETKARNTIKPLYVGPELGWPGQFGGHPDEFVKLIQDARKEMVHKLTSATVTENDQEIANPFFRRNMTHHQAEEASKKHIKGLFDTSHMGMWLNHFRRKSGESEEVRVKEFNKWFLEKTEMLAKSGTVGSIQAVDSASGAHGHLPPGEGIFPIVEAVKLMKKNGFDGFIVSEGHEEEQFGQNRILTQTWKNFGAPVSGSGYPLSGAPGPGWNMMQSAYFRHTYPPNFIVGAYTPSNEWKLWTETPLE